MDRNALTNRVNAAGGMVSFRKFRSLFILKPATMENEQQRDTKTGFDPDSPSAEEAAANTGQSQDPSSGRQADRSSGEDSIGPPAKESEGSALNPGTSITD
jgi:hypothetical protein